MSSTNRQNNLLVAQNWKTFYQTFKNANFQSYDFENLRRVMIDYLRSNFPEDFNDYIESSEYLALIDLIAYIGQSIAYRVDMNARENFLELAERQDSVLRLAKLVSYVPKRHIAASGLLKVTTVQTTENVYDSSGRNLSGQYITWNDASNVAWYDQFISVVNAALPNTHQFGNPVDSANIYNIPTTQYRFNSASSTLPVFGFSKLVAGQNMPFEITSTTFSGQQYIYEEAPKIGNTLACVFMDDGFGAGSARTGFFFNFTQGALNQSLFSITQPSSNEVVNIATTNINNSDVWLYSINLSGAEDQLWTPVPSVTGNNSIYNSTNNTVSTSYSIATKANDSISLEFGDGTFGALPNGTFRVYYRVSNGLSYVINPADISNVSMSFPYISAKGQNETLTLSLSLPSSVANATSAESLQSIKANAPATFYTQNRMTTGEDYNLRPLSVSQQVAKVKSLNRTSSGISRYFDLKDPTSKYSSTTLYTDDGYLYKENYTSSYSFTYSTLAGIQGIINNTIYSILSSTDVRNFYYDNFLVTLSSSLNVTWTAVTTDSTMSTGYVYNTAQNSPVTVGAGSTTDLKYVTSGALVRFSSPTGYYFDLKNNNKLVTTQTNNTSTYIWANVVSITGGGVYAGTGVLENGTGAISLNKPVPTSAEIDKVIPAFNTTLSSGVTSAIVDLIFNNQPFGLRYDSVSQSFQIVFETNLDTTSQFSLANQGNISNNRNDASWILAFSTDNVVYSVTVRNLRYVFGSNSAIDFYFDGSDKIYDITTDAVITDNISILNINTQPDSTLPFTYPINWAVTNSFSGLDGYIDSSKVVVSFTDTDANGVADNPQIFNDVVAPTTNSLTKYLILEKYTLSSGQDDYKYVSNTGQVLILPAESVVGSFNQYTDGQYFYFVDTNVVKQLDKVSGMLVPSLNYKAFIGRDNIKIQYEHRADYNSRIDPGASNIMDVYVLTTNYDTQIRQWISGAIPTLPLPPSSLALENILANELNQIKSISDEIVYHPASYKLLFGAAASADMQANFNVIMNPASTASTTEIKSRILIAINQFFALENWDFGDTFYFTELSTYIMNQLAPDVSNIALVPLSTSQYFGSLFEIKCSPNQIFISCATADNIQIVTAYTSSNLKTVTGNALNNKTTSQLVTSAKFGE